jgi:pyrimidine-nucleoside phosphorylase
MAVCCKGMTDEETHALTDAMRISGACLDWDDPGAPPTADKHSTGGVGDKLSLVIQPLAAACGLRVPSLAGRGLGLTGGTVDKLESIPGYNASLSLAEFKDAVNSCGVSIAAQTAEIAPADKKLYALRDVTGTVPSIPLIVASILSKKLAEGAGSLVFDVKCGEGAFMKTRADAEALASALVSGAKSAGRKAAALVTAMDDPLGYAVGNALEVEEAIDVLQNRASPPDIADLSVELAARMVSLAKAMPLEDALAECRARLADGSAYERFAMMSARHGGDLATFRSRPRARHARDVLAPSGGYVTAIDSSAVAHAAFILGAGRAKSSDSLDMEAGVVLAVARGDKVEAGSPLARLFTNERPESLDAAAAELASTIKIADIPPPTTPRILKIVE